MALTDTAARQAKAKDKQYKLADEKGMFLLVTPKGQKYWRLKYRFAGKEKLLALGVYPEVSLKDARLLRDKAREHLRNQIDPSNAKQQLKSAIHEAVENSFKLVAEEWFTLQTPHWSQSHIERVSSALQKDLYPIIGNRAISTITAPELLQALRKIEFRGAIETANKTKQIAGQIFRYGIATGRCERDVAADLKGALAKPVKRHLAAITEPKEVGKLLLAIETFQGTHTVKTALCLSPLLLCRPGELRHMEWTEINWDEKRWEIPANKMKLKEPHIVPLSTQAICHLCDIKQLTGNGKYVFPSPRGNSRPLSENGVRTALRTLGFDNETMTPHGFRAMGRTILDEVLGYRIDWIEHQLAHAVKDTNGRAYNRTTHLPQRTKMLQHWADYLDTLREKARGANILTGSFISTGEQHG